MKPVLPWFAAAYAVGVRCLALVRLLALPFACGLALTSLRADERIELGGELNARWLVPETSWDGRAVLILHGLASDSEGPLDAQRRLAEALAARGIASLRLNFRGEGDAARTALESTFTTRVEDAETAHAWLITQPGVNADRVGVFGWSLGGATALQSAAAQPDRFRALVLWSSLTGVAGSALRSEMAETAAQADRDGVGSYVIEGWKTITLTRGFFASARTLDLDAAVAAYPGALLSVRGSADYLPQREAEILKLAKGRPAEAVLIGGADHIFNVFQPELGHFDHAVRVTVDWLSREL